MTPRRQGAPGAGEARTQGAGAAELRTRPSTKHRAAQYGLGAGGFVSRRALTANLGGRPYPEPGDPPAAPAGPPPGGAGDSPADSGRGRPHCASVIFAFPTTHAAMAAEDALRAARLSLQVIPKPPALGAGCGLAIRVAGKDALRACRIFDEHAIRFLPPERVD